MSLESGHHEVTTFGAESTLTSPKKLLHDMFVDLVSSRQLAFMLAYRDLRAQYRQSFLGWLWLVIPPIAWAVGLTVLRKNNLADLGHTQLHYPAYVLISMALWQIFSESLRAPMTGFTINRGILTKVRFPKEAIVVGSLLKVGVAVVVQVVLIAAAFAFYRLPLTPSALAFPFGIVVLVILGTTLGIFLTPIGLLYKDIINLMPYIMMAGIAITPVLSPMPAASNDGFYATIVRLNPVTSVLVTTREFATGETLTMLPQFFLVGGVALIGLVFGMLLLRAAMPLVVERWSA